MKAVFAFILILSVAAVCSCASASACTPDLEQPLPTVASWEWHGINRDDFLKRLPGGDIAGYEIVQSPSSDICSGVVMIRRLDRVHAGICLCCLTFEFGRRLTETGMCSERLEGIIYEGAETSKEAVTATVRRLYNDLNIPTAAEDHASADALFGEGVFYEWTVGEAVHAVTSTARRIDTGWSLRITYRRLSPR